MKQVTITRSRLMLALGLGVMASVLAILLDIPGRGEFALVSWLAGAISAYVAGGWRGLAAGLAGVAIGGLAAPLLSRSITLIAVALAVVGAVFGHGWLAGSVVARIRQAGMAALREPSILAGIGVLVASAGGAVWLALAFAEAPL